MSVLTAGENFAEYVKTMDDIAKALESPNARVFVYVPVHISIESVVTMLADQDQVLVVTRDPIKVPKGTTSTIVTQQVLDLYLRPGRMLIVDASELRETLSPKEGRIVVLATPFHSIKDLYNAAQFLTGSKSLEELKPIAYTLPEEEDFVEEYSTQVVRLSPEQYKEYVRRYKKEEKTQRQEPYSAIQALNFMYPLELQRVHNLPREKRGDITPDLELSRGGWITKEHLEHIEQYSPKIAFLLDYVKTHPGKHVVYTHFSDSNGVYVVSTFLRLAGISVVHITGADKEETRLAKITDFNKSQVILVSNIKPIRDLVGVSTFIVFEQHPSATMVDAYQKKIYPHTKHIKVLFLIAVGPNGESTLDVENYNTMAKYNSERAKLVYKIFM